MRLDDSGVASPSAPDSRAGSQLTGNISSAGEEDQGRSHAGLRAVDPGIVWQEPQSFMTITCLPRGANPPVFTG